MSWGGRLAHSLGSSSPPYDSFLDQMVTQSPGGRVEEWACPVLPTLAQPWDAADSRPERCFLGGGGGVAGTPSLSKAWALCFPFTRPGSFPLTPHPSLPPHSWEAVTGVWGRGRGCDELGQLAPPVLWLRWGARKLGRHICRVPSPGSPALAVWHPGCPTGRDRKLPPHWAVCLGTGLICFLLGAAAAVCWARGLAHLQ